MKPINMKTWEVQALLDNRKTVTRRDANPWVWVFEFEKISRGESSE